jgi:hypothetical protein
VGFYSRVIFPRLCDMALSQPFVAKHRQELLSQAQGEILEIGFGTGLNLPHYPERVRKITVVDPNLGMHRKAEKRIELSGNRNIHRHAALDDRERQALGLEVSVVGADECGEMCPCGMAHDEDRVGIAAVFLGVVMSPADRLSDVAGHLLDRNVRHESIGGRDEDESLLDERLGLLLNAGLAPCSPSRSTMWPQA